MFSSSGSGLPEVRPGDIFAGKFRIEELLGAGGYGRVYRATQLPLGRAVALKTISTVYEDGAARFVREASFAQRLEHPNTVRLYDFGTNERGQPYLVLELLRGQPLETMIDRGGPLPLEASLRTTAQILKSLMEAHALGIIHRDIKPANVFITSHPGEPMFVKVLDFGLAKDLGTHVARTAQGTQVGAAGMAQLTRAGEVMGTATYMAPEQVTGGVLSPRSDLYAVGLVLAEMMLGAPLVQGKTAMAVAMAHASPHPIPLPPQLTASRAGPIIQKALAKRPEDRYASAAEMLADVERALLPAPPPPPKGIQVSPRALAAIGIAGVLLLLIAVSGVFLATRWKGESKRARERERELRDEEEESTARARAKTAATSTSKSAPATAPAASSPRPRATQSTGTEFPAVLRDRLARAGYEVNPMSSNNLNGFYTTVLTVVRGNCSGTATVVTYGEGMEAKQGMLNRAHNEGQTFIEGRNVVTLALSDMGSGKPSSECTDPAMTAAQAP